MGADADTIAACATAPGRGGVAIVRVSGARVTALAKQLFGGLPPPRQARKACIADTDGSLLDQGLMLYFPAPHSFTGEHVLEYHAHGSPVLIDFVLQRLAAIGVRLARPGEFSERAFLNGKLDLTQAEGISDLIECATQSGLRAAGKSLQGVFSERVNALFEELTALRVWVEAGIDFSDEDIDEFGTQESLQKLHTVQQAITELQREAKQGILLHDGLSVVIAGAPNAGKSSLLNAMTRQDTALVTAIPGTTRDVIGARIQIHGVPVEIQDTAGLHDSQDPVEKLGMQRARQALEHANVVVRMFDASRGEMPEERYRRHTVIVFNKCDLITSETQQGLRMRFPGAVLISAKYRSGLDDLAEAILNSQGLDVDFAGAFSARRRHLVALDQVSGNLQAAHDALTQGGAMELAAEDLRQAQKALGEITGVFSSDDLLGKIFASFCIGK